MLQAVGWSIDRSNRRTPRSSAVESTRDARTNNHSLIVSPHARYQGLLHTLLPLPIPKGPTCLVLGLQEAVPPHHQQPRHDQRVLLVGLFIWQA